MKWGGHSQPGASLSLPLLICTWAIPVSRSTRPTRASLWKNISRYEHPLLLFTFSYIKKKAFSTDLCTMLFLPLMDLRAYSARTETFVSIFMSGARQLYKQESFFVGTLRWPSIHWATSLWARNSKERSEVVSWVTMEGCAPASATAEGYIPLKMTVSIFMQVCMCSCVHFVNPHGCYYKQMPCSTEGNFLITA